MIKGCLIFYEYSYFFLLGRGNFQDIIALAIKEYEDSGTQASVFHDFQQVLQEHDNDHVTMQPLILDIILNNRMCKFMVFNNIWSDFF